MSIDKEHIYLVRRFNDTVCKSHTIGMTRDKAASLDIQMIGASVSLTYTIPISKKEIASTLIGSASNADLLIQNILKLVMALLPKEFEVTKDLTVDDLYDFLGLTDKKTVDIAWYCIHLLPESLFEP